MLFAASLKPRAFDKKLPWSQAIRVTSLLRQEAPQQPPTANKQRGQRERAEHSAAGKRGAGQIMARLLLGQPDGELIVREHVLARLHHLRAPPHANVIRCDTARRTALIRGAALHHAPPTTT